MWDIPADLLRTMLENAPSVAVLLYVLVRLDSRMEKCVSRMHETLERVLDIVKESATHETTDPQ